MGSGSMLFPSHEVRVKATIEPRFPQRCVRCGAEFPDDVFTIITNVVDFQGTLPWYSGRLSARLPACRGCRWLMRLQRWFRGAVLLGVIALCTWLRFELFGEEVSKLWTAAILVPLAVPYYVWIFVYPPTVEVTAGDDLVIYDFKDAEFARDFEALNPHLVDRGQEAEPAVDDWGASPDDAW